MLDFILKEIYYETRQDQIKEQNLSKVNLLLYLLL